MILPQNNTNVETALKNEITCAVCQDVFVKPYALVPCLHTFCLECIALIPKQHRPIICPICRTRSYNQVPNFMMQNFIDIYKSSTGYEPPEVTPTVNIDSSLKSPCRSCLPDNTTGYTCPNPISHENQTEAGHLSCAYCSESFPARGEDGNTPALNQCCSFCGIIACDAYWGCNNRSPMATLQRLRDVTRISAWLEDIESIEALDEGHINLVEIEYLKGFLCRSGLSWQDAWNTCLDNLDAKQWPASIVHRMTPLAQEIYRTHRMPHNDRDILPSHHLRACYTCLPSIVNGQFYIYWKKMIESNYSKCSKEICPFGSQCQTQWRSEAHAMRFSHIEFSFNRVE